MSFVEALRYASGPGIAAIAGIIISILAEYSPGFQAIPSKGKVAAYTGLCFLVPILATVIAIITGTFGAWADIPNTWWPVIISGLTAAGIGRLFHAYVPGGGE